MYLCLPFPFQCLHSIFFGLDGSFVVLVGQLILIRYTEENYNNEMTAEKQDTTYGIYNQWTNVHNVWNLNIVIGWFTFFLVTIWVWLLNLQYNRNTNQHRSSLWGIQLVQQSILSCHHSICNSSSNLIVDPDLYLIPQTKFTQRIYHTILY